MKILFKTTDRNEANAQLRKFTKNANANLDLRKEAKEINLLTKLITAPREWLEFKGTITANDHIGSFNIAMLVVTELCSVPVFVPKNFGYWYEINERSDRKCSFCAVVYNDKSEYILMDCNDMTAAEATEIFNEVEKNRIR